MNRKQIAVLLYGLGVAISPVANGGVPKSVYVLTEKVDNEGRACGLSEEAILSTASDTLQGSGFALLPESRKSDADFHAYINVNVISLENDFCVVGIEAIFYTYVQAVLPWNEEPTTERAALCNQNRVGITPRSAAGKDARRAIGDAVAQCIIVTKF